MSAEPVGRVHELAAATYWLDARGIVRGVTKAGAVYTREDAVEAIRAHRELVAGKQSALLVDISALRSMAREARAYFTAPEHADLFFAVAIVVKSPLGRAVGNFFIGLNRPLMPTRLFTDEADAEAWLLSFGRLPA
jgi:hypothetical protein